MPRLRSVAGRAAARELHLERRHSSTPNLKIHSVVLLRDGVLIFFREQDRGHSSYL